MGDFETIEEYQQSIKRFKADCIKGFEVVVLSSDNDRAKLQLRLTPYTDKKCGYGCHDLDFGLSVYQHQQAKIDELQNRVDKALEKAYTGIRKQGGDYYLELVEGILKGESNE